MTNSKITRHSSLIYHDSDSWQDKYQELIKELLLSPKNAKLLYCLSHFSDPLFTCSHSRPSTSVNHLCPTNHFEHSYFCKGF